METGTFWTILQPVHLIAGILKCMEEHQAAFPELTKQLENKLYVDDWFGGADSISEALLLIDQAENGCPEANDGFQRILESGTNGDNPTRKVRARVSRSVSGEDPTNRGREIHCVVPHQNRASIDSNSRIESNRNIALIRLQGLLAKTQLEDKLKYHEIFQQYVRDGFIEEADRKFIGTCTYLPHRPVIKVGAETTKIPAGIRWISPPERKTEHQ
ncbi:hypothetical protein OUZ56_016199 [Daphnia magna]|uniref:Uncharacterized protein n=1 Tax=Daphnia magna TaxID=35525 RepID=A0ABR0APY3_9CRUS|nr:hypothetical protein OUZ56_016199 [Daphnia magna]